MARYLALLLCAVLFACSSTPAYNYAKEPDPRSKEYEVGPLDQLRVAVWKNSELSAEATVRPDGVITLPLIGDVKASGKTTTQLQKELAKKYDNFVKVEESQVSITVTQINSYTFTVSGNVEKAGLYKEKPYLTVLEAVALAGGPNKYAGHEAYILRGSPQRKVPIDLKRASSGEHPEENVVVLRGDTIVVP